MSELRKKLLAAKLNSFEKTGNSIVLAGITSDLENANLVSEAKQWWGSELWARLGLMGIGKEERKLRLQMISAAKECLDGLKELEYLITGKDPNKILKATLKYLDLSRPFMNTFIKDLDFLISLANQRKIKDIPILPQKDEPTQQPVYEEAVPSQNEQLERLNVLINIELDHKLSNKIMPSKNIDDEIKKKYKAWLIKLMNKFSSLENDQEDSLLENISNLFKEAELFEKHINKIINELEKNASLAIGEDIRKVAQNAIKRWIRRKLMEISPSMMDQIYLKIVYDLLKIQPILKTIIKTLENKDPSLEGLRKEALEVVSTFQSVNNRLLLLADHMYATTEKTPIRAKTLKSLKDLDKNIELFINPPGDDE